MTDPRFDDRREVLLNRTILNVRHEEHLGEDWIVLVLDDGREIQIFDDYPWVVVAPQLQ